MSGSVAQRRAVRCLCDRALPEMQQIFCDAHAEGEEWHSCMLPPGDEGGEA